MSNENNERRGPGPISGFKIKIKGSNPAVYVGTDGTWTTNATNAQTFDDEWYISGASKTYLYGNISTNRVTIGNTETAWVTTTTTNGFTLKVSGYTKYIARGTSGNNVTLGTTGVGLEKENITE